MTNQDKKQQTDESLKYVKESVEILKEVAKQQQRKQSTQNKDKDAQ